MAELGEIEKPAAWTLPIEINSERIETPTTLATDKNIFLDMIKLDLIYNMIYCSIITGFLFTVTVTELESTLPGEQVILYVVVTVGDTWTPTRFEGALPVLKFVPTQDVAPPEDHVKVVESPL